MSSDTKISAGNYELNKLLYGGYEKDIITTIYGPGGSGKTNMCMMLAVSQAKKNNKVIYIDTEGGFSPERFRQIYGESSQESDRAMQNVLLLNPTSFKEQQESFDKLLTSLKKEEISLIIIDSMVILYRLELGDASSAKDDEKIKEVNRKLANMLRTLNEIARKRHIPIVVTNQVYSTFIRDEDSVERQISMVGGDLLKYWSKCIIELQHYRGKRNLILKKHRSLPIRELEFEITNQGLKKKGLF